MKHPLRRTNSTSLTDDELILFDCLYNTGSWFRPLGRETFEERWNFDSHQLDDKALLETLDRLVHSQRLEFIHKDDRDWYFLTMKGGQEWEAERLPSWERFVRAISYSPSPDIYNVSISAANPSIRDQFWDIGQAVGMFTYAGGPIKKETVFDVPLSRWKVFPEMFTLTAPVNSMWSMRTDWREYERLRTWWKTIPELNSLWEVLT